MAINKYTQPLEQGYIPRYAPLPLDQIGATAGYLQERQDQGLQAYTAFDVARRNSMDQVIDFQRPEVDALWEQQRGQLNEFVESGDYIDAQPVLMRAAADFQQAIQPYNQNYAAYQQAVTQAREMMQEGDITEADYYVAIQQNLDALRNGQSSQFKAGNLVKRLDVDELLDDLSKGWEGDQQVRVGTDGRYRWIQTNEYVSEAEVAELMAQRLMRDERFRGQMERDYIYANRDGSTADEAYVERERSRLLREKGEAGEEGAGAYDRALELLESDPDQYRRARYQNDYIESVISPYAARAGYSKTDIGSYAPDAYALEALRETGRLNRFRLAEAGRDRRHQENLDAKEGGDSVFSPLGGLPMAIQPPRVEHMTSPTAARTERERLRTQANGLVETFNQNDPGRRMRRTENGGLRVERMEAGRWVAADPTSAEREQMRQVRTAVNQYWQIERTQSEIERRELNGQTMDEYLANDPRARAYSEEGDRAYNARLRQEGYVMRDGKPHRVIRHSGMGETRSTEQFVPVDTIPEEARQAAEESRISALRRRDPRLAQVFSAYEDYAQDDPYTVTPVIFAKETLNNQVEGMASRALAERSTNGRLNAARVQAFDPRTGAPVETDRLPELEKFGYDGVFQDADGNTRFAFSANSEDGGVMVYIDAASGVEEMIMNDGEAGIEWYIGRALGGARSGTGSVPTPDGDITIRRQSNGQYVVRTPEGETDTYSSREEARRELVAYYQALMQHYGQ